MDITSLLVRDCFGVIDVEASTANVKAALEIKAEKDREQSIKIGCMLDLVFANVPKNNKIPLDTLCTMVVKSMQPKAYLYKETMEEVESFIRSSSKIYGITRGRNGGVYKL